MKTAWGTAALAGAVLLAAPASATGGYVCRPVSGAGPSLAVVTGHGVAANAVAATIRDGRRQLSTSGPNAALTIAQSWIDDHDLRIDIVDRNVVRYEARLRARFVQPGRGGRAVGTLTRNGRVQRVRCEVDV
jgi:hypothetical protein